ncbi:MULTISPECIES: hypothetical protein [unclassified Pseudomonas]|uniref:hypothetical protein n=1 Tax=unclassified Pseudomonas TaxID=196821 RepID=UPI00244A36F5|nr:MULTISPECIES: hypothetical protein [unclassified Pseudomonas]MDH0301265.1 hypothetical protein [Pseudomonas sp. GD04091]MDH1984665.1 hypothetical protein [Pseudomonas sp. GD03689]
MQVETPEVGAQKANTLRYDTLVIRGAVGRTVPREVDGGEVVAWSLGHGLAAMDALEVFVDDLAEGSWHGLAQGATDALNLMRRRRALGWEADVVAEEPPAGWKAAVSRAEATAREVFGESDDDAMQAIDYMAGLLLAFEPAEQRVPFMFVQLQDGHVMDWTQDANLAEAWGEEGYTVSKLYTAKEGTQ